MKYILLIETGPFQSKQGYLEKILGSEFSIILLKNSSVRTDENNWYHRYFTEDSVILAPLLDINDSVEKIKGHLVRKNIKLSGVFTYQEETVIATQRIAKAFNLPSICNGNPKKLRNKHLMRKSFSAAHIPQPKSVECNNLQEVINAVKKIGVPCIIKPVELLASLGVHKIESFDEKIIEKLFLNAQSVNIDEEDLKHGFDIPSSVLIEEYIPTKQEISVEGCVFKGKTTIVAVTKKYLTPEPEFDETGHATPLTLPKNEFLEMKDILERAIAALGLMNTVFHAEFRLRNNDKPILIEIAARLAGDLIPLIVELATGVDMIHSAINCAVGTSPNLIKKENGEIYSIHFISGKEELSKIKQEETILRSSKHIHDIVYYSTPREGRFGHIIWHGKTIEEIEKSGPIQI